MLIMGNNKADLMPLKSQRRKPGWNAVFPEETAWFSVEITHSVYTTAGIYDALIRK
jgi:hypothetical protein